MSSKYGLGGFRQDLVVRKKVAPPGTPLVDTLLWHVNVAFACRVTDALEEAQDQGMPIDLKEGPLFYEAQAQLVGCSSSLGALIGETWRVIEAEFRKYDIDIPPSLHTIVSSGALMHDYHGAINYLTRWVAIYTEED